MADVSMKLDELFGPGTVKLISNAERWESVVDEAGNMLLDQGFITPPYIEAMKDVVRENGPYIVIAPGIALLHADRQEYVNQVCLGLVKLEQPVEFGHLEYDPVDLAFVLGTLDDHSHTQALEELARLLVDEKWLHGIRTANTKEELLHALIR